VVDAVYGMKLTPVQKNVLIAISSRMRPDGTNLHQSVSALAEKTGFSQPTVSKALRELRAAGLLIATTLIAAGSAPPYDLGPALRQLLVRTTEPRADVPRVKQNGGTTLKAPFTPPEKLPLPNRVLPTEIGKRAQPDGSATNDRQGRTSVTAGRVQQAFAE